MRNEELLIRLTQTQGIAGYEKKVRELIEEEVRPYADELIVDPLGSLIAVKKARVDHTPKRSCLLLTWMKLASW